VIEPPWRRGSGQHRTSPNHSTRYGRRCSQARRGGHLRRRWRNPFSV